MTEFLNAQSHCDIQLTVFDKKNKGHRIAMPLILYLGKSFTVKKSLNLLIVMLQYASKTLQIKKGSFT